MLKLLELDIRRRRARVKVEAVGVVGGLVGRVGKVLLAVVDDIAPLGLVAVVVRSEHGGCAWFAVMCGFAVVVQKGALVKLGPWIEATSRGRVWTRRCGAPIKVGVFCRGMSGSSHEGALFREPMLYTSHFASRGNNWKSHEAMDVIVLGEALRFRTVALYRSTRIWRLFLYLMFWLAEMRFLIPAAAGGTQRLVPRGGAS